MTGGVVDLRSLITIVVVGNGMVGFRFLRLFTERAAQDQYRIVVFGEEPMPAYDRVHLSDFFKHNSVDKLLLAPRSWYEERDIELHTDDPVVAIDREERLVRSRSGREIEFDYLVLATGSQSFIPPVPGIDAHNVYVYRTIDDVTQIKRRARSASTAAIIGGGLLGLESAVALGDMKIETTVVQNTSHLMPSQLDQGSGHLLKSQVEELGIRVHVESVTQSIEALEDGRLRLHFDDSQSLDVDMLVVAAGIRPRDELARAAGLEVSSRGGIVVNDKLTTTDNEILAIGECARHNNIVYGLVSPGYEMAAVAVENLLGRRTQFESGDISVRLKLDSIKVSVIGDVNDGEGVPLVWEGTDSRRTIKTDADGRIKGAVIVGDWDAIPEIEEAVITGRKLAPELIEKFKQSGEMFPRAADPIAMWPRDRVVCSCVKVKVYQITELVAEGINTVEGIAAKCDAGSVCGSCRPFIAELCGDTSADIRIQRQTALIGLSLLSLVACFVFWLLDPWPMVDSIESFAHRLTALWRDDTLQQTTGYVLVGVSALALLLSLRKRIRRFQFATVSWFRAFHAAIGVLTIILLGVHTGLRAGYNLNFTLLAVFVAVNITGGVVGLAAGMETSRVRARATLGRRYRPLLTWVHLLALWVLPPLLAFHILGVYYY